jgi:hypothetical protein
MNALIVQACDLCGLAPIVDDIDIGSIVTRVIVPLHGHALEVGAKTAGDESLPGLVATGVGAGYETFKVFRGS